MEKSQYVKKFFLIIRAFKGGNDSVECMLFFYKIFLNFFKKNNIKYEIIDMLQNKKQIKKIIFKIDYLNLYYLLNLEKGINRIIRKSPFNKNNKIQTSFVQIIIFPFISSDININPKDLTIIQSKATGAGGQHVNKTNSAVLITHNPTKITVKVQTERSFHQNLELAKKLIYSKIYIYYKKKNINKIKNIIDKKKIIRSIFFTTNIIIDHYLNKSFFGKNQINNFLKGNLNTILIEKVKLINNKNEI